MNHTRYIAVSTQKGGAGKTTLTVLLASFLHYTRGYNVAIIDCDYPQHSIVEMREREIGVVTNDDYYKSLAYAQFTKINKKAYHIVSASFENAIAIAEDLIEQQPELDYIFFDLPGTVNALGLTKVISSMDYIFTPIIADRVVLESSVRFASIVNERMITTAKTSIKGIYMIWNMVDRREKSELYDVYEAAINELGIPIMEIRMPDSKRFRRELSEQRRPIFRSTIFPIDRKLIRGSMIEEFALEFLTITEKL